MGHAAAYYHDEYVKIGGDWKISSCGFVRIYEAIIRPGSAAPDLSVDPRRGFPIAK